MAQGKLSSRVKVESLLSVVSAKPTESGKIHKLSRLDQAMGLHTIHIVFYYRTNPFNGGPMSTDLDNIRVTLSQLLDQYPVITGRLARIPDGAGWHVKLNDAGVRMLQASVSTTLDEWMRSADASEERDLTVWEDMPLDPSFWSPFRIQINNFKCGGLAIGLSCTHMHADITSATLLIKSWTEVHRGRPLTHPPNFHLPSFTPSHQPNSIQIPSLMISTSSNSANAPPKMATATMRFSDSVIGKCLSQVKPQCPNATPFDFLAALFWSRIAQWQEPPSETRSLSICIDSRNRGHPSIPFGYFGNALHFSTLTMDVDKLMMMRGGLGQVCEYVHQHVAGVKVEDFLSVMSWLEEHGKDGEEPRRIYGERLTCISTEHMVDAENGEGLMYSAVFDKGERPVHVSYHVGNVEREGLIAVMPSPEGRLGRTITVVLPQEQIAKLCEDQAILDLDPKMLLPN